MSLNTFQHNLLRVLGYGRFEPVGEQKTAATIDRQLPFLPTAGFYVHFYLQVLPQIRRTRCPVCESNQKYEFCHNPNPVGFRIYMLKQHTHCYAKERIKLANKT